MCRHRQRHRSGVVAFMCHQLLNLIYILCVPAIALIAFLAGSLSSCSRSIRTDWARAGIFAHLRATAATKGRKFYLLALIWHPASAPLLQRCSCIAANCTNCALSQPMNWPPFIVTTVNKLHHTGACSELCTCSTPTHTHTPTCMHTPTNEHTLPPKAIKVLQTLNRDTQIKNLCSSAA